MADSRQQTADSRQQTADNYTRLLSNRVNYTTVYFLLTLISLVIHRAVKKRGYYTAAL